MAFRKLAIPMRFVVALLLVAILVSLHLMSTATQNSAEIGSHYTSLVVINSIALMLLLILVGANLYWLVKQVRRRQAGSRLTARMIFVFILLALAPSSLVFIYSINFLHQSIDSWFDVQVDQAMEDALELSQASLDQRMRSQLKITRRMSEGILNNHDDRLAIELDRLRVWAEATELMVITSQKHIIAYSNNIPDMQIPSLPSEAILSRVRLGEDYVGLDPVLDEDMQIRALVTIDLERSIFLQALYPVPFNMTLLADRVEVAYAHYKKMGYLRQALKTTFAITLFLILLISLLAAVWVTFLSIRKLVAPLRDLEKGTMAVAAGNYERRIPVNSRDELGILVQSFNYMIEQVAQARDETSLAHLEAENQRAYLETVLRHLTSGVISIDEYQRLRTANQAASNILNIELKAFLGNPISSLLEANPHLDTFVNLLPAGNQRSVARWEEQISYAGLTGQRQLLCRGTLLSSPQGVWSGTVMVFDDMTDLIRAQRSQAWSEVAQRMAHEIKNPLTPIQLSAERLRSKLAPQLADQNAQLLETSTRTIIRQVDALKEMVDAFSAYARAPGMHIELIDVNDLIKDVVTLYASQQHFNFHLVLDRTLEKIPADSGRLTQVLHNLIKNAEEALSNTENASIWISTRSASTAEKQWIEISIRDNGAGIDAEQMDHLFEPYVSSKIKGTGLGLAIVKRIIEEHRGTIQLNSSISVGAEFIIHLPTDRPQTTRNIT